MRPAEPSSDPGYTNSETALARIFHTLLATETTPCANFFRIHGCSGYPG